MADLEVGKIGGKEATVLFQHLLVFCFSLFTFGHFLPSFFICLILLLLIYLKSSSKIIFFFHANMFQYLSRVFC